MIRVLGIAMLAALGCNDADEVVASAGAPPASEAGRAADAPLMRAGVAADAPQTQPGCIAPAGVSNAPRSIGEVVALLNVLPKPTSLPCLLDALAKPFSMQATYSVLSAQPADGMRSPRMFLFFDPLVLSVVPAGSGSHLLEFGERRSETASLKGELEFPITQELEATAPFDRLRFSEDTATTTCGFCHQSEDAVVGIDHPFARTSQALRPIAMQRVSVEALRQETLACDVAVEAERCAMLRTLFDPARPATEREFPAGYKTFF